MLGAMVMGRLADLVHSWIRWGLQGSPRCPQRRLMLVLAWMQVSFAAEGSVHRPASRFRALILAHNSCGRASPQGYKRQSYEVR